MSKEKDYLDISEVEDIKNISAEDSGRIRDRDIKIKLTPLFCSLASLASVAVAVLTYIIRKDLMFSSQMLLATGLLIYVSCVDIKMHMAPNWIPIALLIVGIPSVVINCVKGNNIPWILINSFGGLFLGFILLFISSITSKGGIGMADVKVTAAAGFILGIESVFLGQLIGLTIAFIYAGIMLIRKKANKKTRIALLPFLSAGIIISAVLPPNLLF